MIIFLLIDRFPISVPVFGASTTLAITGVITFKELFKGFSSNTIMLIIGTMIIGESLFRTGAANFLGNKIIGLTGNN